MKILTLLLLVVIGTASVQTMPASTPAVPSLLSNGDFSLAKKDPNWPDDWNKSAGVNWETEEGSHFLRFTAPARGGTTRLVRTCILSPDVRALQILVRYRTANLKTDPKKHAVVGVLLYLFDSVEIELAPEPAPIVASDHTAIWTTISERFNVPDGAASLRLLVGLFQTDSGTLDVSNIDLIGVPPRKVRAPVASASQPGEAVPPADDVPIHREDGRTILGDGKPSVWFIHPYVDVLGHDFVDGLKRLIRKSREQGHPITIGVARSLEPALLADESDTIYVFSYKNINYPLPADAKRLIFLNTWLVKSVQWPAERAGKDDLVVLGSRTLNNNGDGLATDKARWQQIQKDDPSLQINVLDATGYYLTIPTWTGAVQNRIADRDLQAK